ncbi:MAG: HD domain-containing protein, partial [Negativicutes bacterium]|nr:HD domain-containing protein [Negativicutes bacterium]
MLRIALEYVQPGMIISRNIYNANGSLLLGRDLVLDANFIKRLTNLNIDAIYVKNPLCDIEPAEEILHETTRVKAVKFTKAAFESFQKTQNLNVVGMAQILQKMIEDILSHKNVVIHLTDIRTRDDYTFGHSINVCLIAAMIGVKMRLNEQQLYELALGALLHDVGMMMISPALVNKKQRLSAEEWGVIKEHSALGFEILRKQGSVPLVAAHVAFQHHENYDGSGYPRNMSKDEIHRYAR